MKKKKLNEAGNFSKLTPEEIQILKSYSPDFANSVGQVVGSLRAKGKNIDLSQAVGQLKQVGYNSPEIDKFLQSSSLVAPMQNVQKDPFKQRDSIPGAGVSSPQTVAQKRTVTDKSAPIRQRLQMAGQKPAQPQQQPVQPTPADQFEQIRTNPNMSNDDVLAQNKMQQPITNRQQLKSKWQAKGINPLGKTQVQEAMNPAAMMKLKPVMDMLKKLQPEDLVAVANMVQALIGGGANGSFSYSRTSQLNAGKLKNMTPNQKLMTEVLVVKINEQKEARATAQKLLEGPLGNVWDKIKGAGTAVGQKMGLMGQQQQQMQNVGVDENSKRAAQEMQKLLGKVNQFRSKFNSSILKNAESMNGYHDLVLNAVQMYQQYQSVLGPFGQQLAKQIHDAVGQLVYDLNSEKEQIDTFLKSLKDIGTKKSAKSLGNDAKKRAQASRAAENPDAGAAYLQRFMPMGGGSVDPNIANSLGMGDAKEQAMNKFRSGDKAGSMNDLQKLYMRQINKEKGTKKKSTKKSTKKKTA